MSTEKSFPKVGLHERPKSYSATLLHQTDGSTAKGAYRTSHYFHNPEDYFLYEPIGSDDSHTPPPLSRKDIILTGVKASIVSTTIGYTSSTLTAFNPVFKLLFKREIPFAIHRHAYNTASGLQGGIRSTNSPSVCDDEYARNLAYASNAISFVSFVSAVGVSFLMLRRGAGSLLGFAKSSAGFNLTGILNIVGAAGALGATALESNKQEKKLTQTLSKHTGITLEEAEKVVKKTVPHLTTKEIVTRQGGLFFSGIGSATGMACALLAPSPLTRTLAIISGVSFGAGLSIPLLGDLNSDDECKFSPEKNEHFKQIKNAGLAALVPTTALTLAGFVVLKKFPTVSWLRQIPIHGLEKCDNTFVLATLLSTAGALSTTPNATRLVFALDDRNEGLRRTIREVVQSHSSPHEEGSYTKRILAEAETIATRKKEATPTPSPSEVQAQASPKPPELTDKPVGKLMSANGAPSTPIAEETKDKNPSSNSFVEKILQKQEVAKGDDGKQDKSQRTI